MSENHYAVEVQTGGTYDDSAVGMTTGYMRFVTDRPDYDGTETGDSLIPTGEHSLIKINLSGAETIGVAFQSGQLYTASNGGFKSANTVLPIGSRFTVLDASDFTGGELATAKGSAPAEGDLFEVSENESGSEAVTYAGKNVWYEDFITKKGMSNPSRRVDLEGTGDYGTLSGFNFQIDNSYITGTGAPIWRTLNSNDVYLNAKIVRVYSVIGDSFYQIWTGVIDNNPMNETDLKFVCKSNFKQVHNNFPPNVFNDVDYPNSIDSVNDEAVPVCIGDVEYASIKNVSGDPAWITLVSQDFGDFDIAQATAYSVSASGTSITLATEGVSFSADELIGNQIFIGSGKDVEDTDRGYLIIDNAATSGGTPATTQITVAEPIEDFSAATYGYSGSADEDDKWQFKIADISTTGVVSNQKIGSFKTDSSGVVQLWSYSSEDREYVDVKYATESVDVEDSDYNNTATVDAISTNISKDGNIAYRIPIGVSVNSIVGTGNAPVISNPITNVTDFDRTAVVEARRTALGGESSISLEIDFDISFGKNELDFDELYFGIDLEDATAPAIDSIMVIQLRFYNQYNAVTHSQSFITSGAHTNWGSFNFLPDDYYRNAGSSNLGGEDSDFGGSIAGLGENRTNLLIDSAIYNGIKSGSLQKRVVMQVSLTYGSSPGIGDILGVDIKQIGIHGYKAIDITNTTLYTRVSGELLSDGVTESNTVYNAFRLMLEDYNGLGSHQIDYGNLAATRASDWYVGRQIADKKNLAFYLKELAQNSFVAIFQDRVGKIHLNAWRSDSSTAHTHDDTTVVRDSISDWKLTGIDRVFNNFLFLFSPNPAEDKYFSQYSIKDVDDDSAVSGMDWLLQPLWYVSNACYKIYNIIKEFRMELPWFSDRNRWYNSDDTGKDGLGIDSSHYRFCAQAVFWLTRQKRRVKYRLPLDSTNVSIELTDPVEFRDRVYTNSAIDSAYLQGNIEYIEYDLERDQIVVQSILEPNDTIGEDYGDIIETGSASDTITESGSQPDTITEVGIT